MLVSYTAKRVEGTHCRTSSLVGLLIFTNPIFALSDTYSPTLQVSRSMHNAQRGGKGIEMSGEWR